MNSVMVLELADWTVPMQSDARINRGRLFASMLTWSMVTRWPIYIHDAHCSAIMGKMIVPERVVSSYMHGGRRVYGVSLT